MNFPKGKVILENTKLSFVNFDKILNAAKEERAFKISSYISITYADSIDILLLKLGEPYNAITLSHNERSLIGISHVIKKAKESSFGTLNFYEVPEKILDYILISSTQKANFTLQERNEIKKYIVNFKNWIEKFKDSNFNGFFELINGIEVLYFSISNGELTNKYSSKSISQTTSWKDFITLLDKTIKNSDKKLSIKGFHYKDISTKSQVLPSQISLCTNSLNNAIKLFSDEWGGIFVSEIIINSFKSIKSKYSFINELTYNNNQFEGNIFCSPEELIDIFAFWFDLLKDSFIMVSTSEKVDIIIQNSIKEYRFALKSLGFFKKCSINFIE